MELARSPSHVLCSGLQGNSNTEIFVGYITVLVSLLLLPLIDFRFFFAVGLLCVCVCVLAWVILFHLY